MHAPPSTQTSLKSCAAIISCLINSLMLFKFIKIVDYTYGLVMDLNYGTVVRNIYAKNGIYIDNNIG